MLYEMKANYPHRSRQATGNLSINISQVLSKQSMYVCLKLELNKCNLIYSFFGNYRERAKIV